tara:strand:- start:1293 stop:1700 length:408 start_codon:yes stop_codon:yes gene_type:complete
MEEGFKKHEKLKSKILIDKLFAEGISIKNYPLRLVYIPITSQDSVTVSAKNRYFKTGFSVPKKFIKTAVQRNRIKRLMRESFRKNKYIVMTGAHQQYALMFIYLSREDISQIKMEQLMLNLLERLKQKEKISVIK